MKSAMGLLAILPVVFLSGCAASSAATACSLSYVMTPTTATADHSAAAPGNQVQFGVGEQASAAGCAAPQVVRLATLASSDTINVSLATPGVATCVGATTVPATLTDTVSKATAQLTCK